ncbi:histidine kinase [Pseudomonas sp. HMWF032]|uniref:HDOD domain-containing protein n=1 Tax=unclassified Pseudomonas TaxID=196821 RepID=UPI000D386B34|nr:MULTISPECIES: HDOD domain-containing protein [unclassified Pseudomonas]PTS85228.1 histidine kinase [Pseudomonas sp. HMWF032]PTT86504.1 histidine kinase [Pseudomonas sp. HMWF010]WAC42874.1 HDOD domain-containing protein [Pseudomonas sp. SL4(2022)]
MPKPAHYPRTLKDWLKQLDEQLLPASSTSLQLLRQALADSNRSRRELAELMQSCPALALSVLREANSKNGGLNEQTDSLEAAISRLGLSRTEALLKRIPSLPEQELSKPYRQILLISQHASQQANGLFAGRLARLWQEVNWGSQLFLAPVWALLCAHPELFDAWEQRVLLKGEAACKVEQELLGVPLLTLCLALSEHWRLPEWVTLGYRLLVNDRRLLVKALHIAHHNEHPLQQQQCLDEDSNLRRWLTQPANSILLANCLAISAHFAWNSLHTLRWQRLTGLFLQLPLDSVQQQIHQHAASSAQQLYDNDLWHPAESLLWPWQARHLQPPAEPPKPVELSAWRQQCGQLLAQPSAFSNVLQLTACANQALQACGMQRVLILLADRNHTRLMTQQHTGLDKSADSLSLDPQQSQLLRRLLSTPAQLRLGPGNIAQFSATLPGTLKSLFPSEHLLIRSLANNNRVVMLIFADQGGNAFSDTSVQGFSKTVQCIERALNTFASRGR